MHLALVVLFFGAVDAHLMESEESGGLAAAAVNILLPLAASAAAIAGAGALVAGSITRGIAGTPAANRHLLQTLSLATTPPFSGTCSHAHAHTRTHTRMHTHTCTFSRTQ